MMSSMGLGIDPDQGHLQKQNWVSDLGCSRPERSMSTESGGDPHQEHLLKQDWVSDLGQSKPEAMNSRGTGLGHQPRLEQT